MKLSEWARANGVSRQTATRWFHAGILPVPARQVPTGAILVDEQRPPGGETALYSARLRADQKTDLERQVARLAEASTASGLAPTMVITDVGSGVGGKRPRLRRSARDSRIRLTRGARTSSPSSEKLGAAYSDPRRFPQNARFLSVRLGNLIAVTEHTFDMVMEVRSGCSRRCAPGCSPRAAYGGRWPRLERRARDRSPGVPL